MDTVIIVGMLILMIAMLMLVFTHSMVLQRFGIMEFAALAVIAVCMYLGYRESASIVMQSGEIYSLAQRQTMLQALRTKYSLYAIALTVIITVAYLILVL